MSNTQTTLASLMAPVAKPTTTKGARPIGSINVKLGGVNVFSRSVWAESTSETPFLNELNDLAQADPVKATAVIKQLLSQMEVDIITKQTSDKSLADFIV